MRTRGRRRVERRRLARLFLRVATAASARRRRAHAVHFVEHTRQEHQVFDQLQTVNTILYIVNARISWLDLLTV